MQYRSSLPSSFDSRPPDQQTDRRRRGREGRPAPLQTGLPLPPPLSPRSPNGLDPSPFLFPPPDRSPRTLKGKGGGGE